LARRPTTLGSRVNRCNLANLALRISLRQNALGWSGTGKAIERLKEVIGEIDLLTSTKQALAGEDAVLSLETPNFAINQIDMAPASSCREAGSSAPGM